jgi:hypothetical protein
LSTKKPLTLKRSQILNIFANEANEPKSAKIAN